MRALFIFKLKIGSKVIEARRLFTNITACVINIFLLMHVLGIRFGHDFRIWQRDAMKNCNNTGPLTTQIDELKKEISILKNERKALFFIASCGISYAVLQFSFPAAIILIVVSFSFCFLEDIVRGE